MRVTLDDQPCQVPADSIRDALAGAAAAAEANGRIIVEVMVDGQAWSQDDLGSAERCDGVAGHLELISTDRDKLVCRTLSDVDAALLEIDGLQRAAAESLQVGETAEGMGRLGEALELWLLVERGIGMSTETAGVDLPSVIHDGEPVGRAIHRLKDQLRGIRDALAGHDHVSLADGLLYELPDVIAYWRSIVGTVRALVESRDAGTTPDTPETGA
ncbi:MAG: hypothetical protein AB8G96_12055 [Phycisphaerales bacterium]